MASASKANLLPFINVTDGWQTRLDPAKSGGFRIMSNVFITDRGGLATRPGTELFGASDSGGEPVMSMHTSIRRDGTNILLRSSETKLEYYNRLTDSFATLKSGFTSGQIFGFADHNTNATSTDYCYYCNAVEPYQRWTIGYDKTSAALAGGETAIPLTNGVFESDVYYSGTATSVTTTTVVMPAGTWATDIWNGFWVYITSGAAAGKVSKITATSATQLTFAAIATLAGTPTFEIRRLKFTETGTVIINGTTVAYTAPTDFDALPVASAPAAADDSPLAQYPEELMTNSCPRGNVLKVLFSQMYVAGVKAFPSTIYRSKLLDAADFRYSGTRLAGEGDVVNLPTNGPIYDIEVFEDKLVLFFTSAVWNLTYTQDANDIAQKLPIVQSPLIGTTGRVFRMGDDIVFANPSNEVQTLTRVATRDIRPLAANLAADVKRTFDTYNFDSARGMSWRNYSIIACKETEDSETNDIVVVYDKNVQRWVGKWDIPASCFTVYDNELYLGSSASNEVYKMFTPTTATVKGADLIGYASDAVTNWVNKTPDGSHLQDFNIIRVTGYIRMNTTVTFNLYYDFGTQPELSWTFDPASATSTNMILQEVAESQIGVDPLGVTQFAAYVEDDVDAEDERRFVVYFVLPFRPHLWSSIGWNTDGVNKYVEVTEVSANFHEAEAAVPQNKVQSIEAT